MPAVTNSPSPGATGLQPQEIDWASQVLAVGPSCNAGVPRASIRDPETKRETGAVTVITCANGAKSVIVSGSASWSHPLQAATTIVGGSRMNSNRGHPKAPFRYNGVIFDFDKAEAVVLKLEESRAPKSQILAMAIAAAIDYARGAQVGGKQKRNGRGRVKVASRRAQISKPREKQKPETSVEELLNVRFDELSQQMEKCRWLIRSIKRQKADAHGFTVVSKAVKP